MTEYYADESVTLHHGDCLDVLREMAEHSVDAVVTDPPYGLGFMGKAWDSPGGTGDFPMRRTDAINTVNTGASRQGGRQRSTEDWAKRQARDARAYGEWCEQWAAECLRVLKPGGFLLAFGGTRTYHRIACAVEDVGFEIRDSISWLYGQGFPKSLDLSKVLDKQAGEWRGRAAELVSANGAMSGANYGRTEKGDPITPAAAAAGWGTALKPAHEPIVVARKSLVGTVVANWLEHGTGALNIDACRTALDSSANLDHKQRQSAATAGMSGLGESGFKADHAQDTYNAAGRWPTNVVLDDSQAVALDEQTGTLVSGANPTRRGSDKFRNAYGDFAGQEECTPARGADSGGASRFFPTFRYEVKAATAERPVGDDGTVHPTVKPLDLMRWLVRLVTPREGTVLDPFAGSGTTAEACVLENLRCIAVEREADYLPLIVARLSKPLHIGFDFGEALA